MLLLSLFYCSFSYAEFKDPTRPATFSVAKETKKKAGSTSIKLSAIWVSGGIKRATINGETVKEGKTIHSTIKVLQILADSVVIRHKNKRRVLHLLNTLSKKTATDLYP